jgi:hypothetical protein
MLEKRQLESVNEDFEAVEKGEVTAHLVFDFGVRETIRQPEGILADEAAGPSGQPVGEAKEQAGPVPG